ncbi:MAG TPA: hypothetical protein VF334_08710 [Polyangia bacterium]
MDPKEPKDGGGEVISLDDARKKSSESGGDGQTAGPQTVTLNGADFLKPVMAAIARELAGVADPDGSVRVGGSDEASRAKTAAVVKGLGIGLGQALAEAFGKYAQKIETGQVTPPVKAVIDEHAGDDDKKPS